MARETELETRASVLQPSVLAQNGEARAPAGNPHRLSERRPIVSFSFETATLARPVHQSR